jgi:hypothetical protein
MKTKWLSASPAAIQVELASGNIEEVTYDEAKE